MSDLDLIWIEIGVFNNKRNELTRPVMGTIFSFDNKGVAVAVVTAYHSNLSCFHI